MNDSCWIPNMELLDDYNNDWKTYQSALYGIFKHDFVDSHPFFNKIRVSIKHYPIEYGKEEAFFHTTCKDYTGNGERVQI